MPSRWELSLPTQQPEAVRLEHLHAVVSRWFDTDDTAHRANSKGYTVSPLRQGDQGPVIEIGLVDDNLIGSLLANTAPGTPIRLGRTHIAIPTAPTQTAAATWHALAQPGHATAWCLRFVTPLTFRRGNRFTPMPTPKTILASLRATWRTYAPADIAQPDLDLSHDPVWVTDIDGANDVRKVNDRIVSGFLGRLRIECDAEPHIARAVNQVIQLAPFSGIGAHTTRGFGVTRIEPTWQPHPIRTP
jgi:CRISPR-associated endoribonuclease Cas6